VAEVPIRTGVELVTVEEEDGQVTAITGSPTTSCMAKSITGKMGFITRLHW
jgi:hypothetical protein